MLKKISPKVVFITLSIIGILAFFLYAYVNGEYMWIWLLQESNPDIKELDYAVHISSIFSGESLYEYSKDVAIPVFPPLAYLMYQFFFKLGFANINEIVYNAENIISHKINAYVFDLYSILSILLLLYSFIRIGKKYNNVKLSVALFFIFFFSAPILSSGFYTGNSIIIVIALLLLFFALRDSEIFIEREIAMILLAISAGLKIYPALFGLLYIFEKRYKEAFRLIIYGILFFFVPFIFFGGVNGFTNWLSLLGKLGSETLDGRIQYIKGLTYMFGKHIIVNQEVLNIVSNITPYIFLVIMLILILISKNQYRKIYFITCIMMFFPAKSYRYVLSYMFIPFVLWIFKEGDNPKLKNYFISIIYGMIFSIPVVYGLLTGMARHIDPDGYYYTLTYLELYLYACAYLFLFIEFILQIKDLFKKEKLITEYLENEEEITEYKSEKVSLINYKDKKN